MRAGLGGVTLSLVRAVTPDVFGTYQSAADKIITGGIFKIVKRGPANAFIEVGASEAVANLFDGFVMPALRGLGGQLNVGLRGQKNGNGSNRASNPLALIQR